MRVSVIIPLYNKAAFVRRCLTSVAAQTFRDFETIVVDDGSEDGSRQIAEECAELGLFRELTIRIVAQANAGPGSARNRAASLATGEMLAFLDADDEWAPAYLANNLAALEAAEQSRDDGRSIAAAVSGYIEYPSGESREGLWRRRGLEEGTLEVSPRTPAGLFAQILAYHACGNTMVRADVFRELGGFYDRDRCVFAEDSWFWVQVLLREPVLIRFEPLTYIHREASELSGNYRSARPIEPFLLDPAPLEARCPARLRELLRGFLAFRALKTACVLGYWGSWREAARLRRRFVKLGSFRAPYFWPALVCSTPLGGMLGSAWRRVRLR